MAQAGIHALVGFQVARVIPPKKFLGCWIIIGALLPDLDLIIVALASILQPIEEATQLYHRSFSHNFFIIIFLYLICALVSEIINHSRFKVMGKGLSLGMLTHLILDTLFWFTPIYLLWPLPLKPFNFWSFMSIPEYGKHIIMIIEFLFFYIYAAFLIQMHLTKPHIHTISFPLLIRWKKIEIILFLLFVALLFFNVPGFKVLFSVAYIPSLIFAIFATWQSRHCLDQSLFITQKVS